MALLGGMRLVPHQRYEAVRLEGARNRAQEFLLVTLPAVRPQLIFAAVMQLSAVIILGIEGLNVYRYSGVFEFGQAAALCLIIIAPVSGIYFLIRRCIKCAE
jgi:ABC-type sugar transport system permease subunit